MAYGSEYAAAAQTVLGGVQVAGGFASNKKNRRLSRDINSAQLSYGWDMYNQQRGDSISDRDYENWYNSPKQMMQRYKEAGLNPNLIYGGGSGAESASARSSSPGSSNLDVPRNDQGPINEGLAMIGSAFREFVEIQNTQAKTDNLREQRDLILAEIQSQQAGVRYTDSRTNTEVYNLDYAKGQRRIREQQEQANLNSTLANTQYTLDQNQRAQLLNSTNVAKTLQDITAQKISMLHERLKMNNTIEGTAKIKQELANLKTQEKLLGSEQVVKQAEAKLAEKRIFRSDNMFYREIIQVIEDALKYDSKKKRFPIGKPKM